MSQKLDDIIAELKQEHELIRQAIESLENLNTAVVNEEESWPATRERRRTRAVRPRKTIESSR